MKSREYQFLLRKKIKKYQYKTPDIEYFQKYMSVCHLFTLKNVRSYLIKE